MRKQCACLYPHLQTASSPNRLHLLKGKAVSVLLPLEISLNLSLSRTRHSLKHSRKPWIPGTRQKQVYKGAETTALFLLQKEWLLMNLFGVPSLLLHALLEHWAAPCSWQGSWVLTPTPLLVSIPPCLPNSPRAFGWGPPSPPILLLFDIRAPDFSVSMTEWPVGFSCPRVVSTFSPGFSLFLTCDLPLSLTPKTTHRAGHTFSRYLLTKE